MISMMHPKILSARYQPLLIAAALALLVFSVFSKTLSHPFINYDDETYVTQNRHLEQGLTWPGIQWAFTAQRNGDWQPLIWLSFLLDRQLFGLNPSVFHFINVFWHACNTLLIFFIFRKLTGRTWASAFLAVFFAVHPLRVESVAWISERKDVVSGFFWWLTIWAYIKTHLDARPGYRGASILFYALGALSKAMVVTLPAVLLLLDYWPLRRFEKSSFWALVKEKIPYGLFALLSAVMVLQANLGTPNIIPFHEAPMHLRLSNAVISYFAYIVKTVVPLRLAIFYPFPHAAARSAVWAAAGSFALAAMTWLAWKKRKTSPYLLVGWLWYLLTLVPVLGILRLTYQAMANRYTYLPHTGLGLMAVWTFLKLPQKIIRPAGLCAFILLPAFWIQCTLKQLSYWSSDFRLNEHAAKVVPDNFVAYANLGYAYFKQEKLDKALSYYQKSSSIHPLSSTYLAMGIIYFKKNDFEKAKTFMLKALKMRPQSASVLHNLGMLNLAEKNDSKAEEYFLKVLSLKPDFFFSKKALASLYLKQGLTDKARIYIEGGLRQRPRDGFLNWAKARELELNGNRKAAFDLYLTAAFGEPPSPRALDHLTLLWLSRGETVKAKILLKEVISRNPYFLQGYLNMANVLLAEKNFDGAVATLGKALSFAPNSPAAKNLLQEALRAKETTAADLAEQETQHLGAGLNISSPQELGLLLKTLSRTTSEK